MSGSPRCVTVSISGGVGNQLFQLAAALDIARGDLSRIRVVVAPGADLGLLRRLVGVRLTEASPARMLLGGFVPSTAPRWVKKRLKTIRWRIRSTGSRLGLTTAPVRSPFVSERSGSAGGSVRRFGPWAFAEGYFQDVKWAEAHSQDLVKLIRRNILDDHVEGPPVVVHVRGGDYRNLGWLLKNHYYLRVLDSGFLRRDELVCVLGDDPVEVARVRQLLERAGAQIQELPDVIDPTEAALRDFSTIVLAERVVMSNSTFCWWATSVGDAVRPGRPVAYPSGWIDGSAETRLSRALKRPEWESFPS
jgi:hypothetical protein